MNMITLSFQRVYGKILCLLSILNELKSIINVNDSIKFRFNS